jgi:SAM-dependent methyltransferase
MVQAPERSSLMPSEGVLALHNHHAVYNDFEAFYANLPTLLQQGALLEDCISVTRALGILEPLTGEHIPPEALLIQGPNYRESLIANGLLSRNRALLDVLQSIFGSLEQLAQQQVYLVEAVSGFALWLQRQLGKQNLVCSEYLEQAEQQFAAIAHQDLCALTYADASFDLVICNELFEHVQDLDQAFREIARVLKPGGRLMATCPMAFGQRDSIIKAVHNKATGLTELVSEADFHGNPMRPTAGSLVYRIPGWEMLEQLQQAGFLEARIHHVASWKHGVMGSDLPGVLVIEAQR